ncbi:Co-chaperone [Coemansia helicoidea]|uniref:Co-chaperone n=1 Tax=Coemansia helicoidea TaxID=1286919 RepID=A0ACC1LF06_9FUNG|nr:Co-chaperone [Coemansia helicoidea]
MADWRNVGNWHWKERNCLEWAKTYLNEQLVGVEAAADGITAKVVTVDAVTGDADLNIRKGRLLAIYDLEVKLAWKASRGDDEIAGQITIPEVAHDTDEFVYEVTSASTAIDQLPLKDFVRKQLAPAIGKKLSCFTDDMKKANGQDMYIPDSNKSSGASTPAAAPAGVDPRLAKEFKSGKVGSSSADAAGVAKAKGATFSTVTVKQTSEFMCSADDLYTALTDPQRAAVWTRGAAEIQPVAGSRFKLFGGHIEGEITKLEPGKRIEQTWRVATWPAGHFSRVQMELEQLSTSTRLSLTQTDVPLTEEGATKTNWDRYYWNAIKGSFG